MKLRRRIWLLGLPALLAGGAGAQQKKPLAIIQAALLEAEGGLPARADTVYQPGETLYLAFHVQGYTVDRGSRLKLSYRVDALDFNGLPFAEPEIGQIDTELAPQDAKWLPRVRYSPALPPFADSGRYKFTLKVVDEVGKTETAQELLFQVRGRRVEPSDALVIRNFAFSRQEDGEALSAAAYRRGDVLWAAFDLTGYKMGEKNRIDVDYDLSVLDGEGKLIFRQPEPAREQGTSFYPRRYVHAVFSLNLEAGLPRGQYTIVLTARDLSGSQTCQGRFSFTVE